MLISMTISGVASYDGDGVEISNLKKVNFFYGANGCGKTTISNFLANAGDARFENCSVRWLGDRPIKPLVYNKEFRENNFSAGNIAGVFTLGKATKEDLDEIRDKKRDLSILQDSQSQQKIALNNQKNKLQEHDEKFTNDCWLIYKQYEIDLKDALRGSIGSKKIFKDKILLERARNTSDLLSLVELKDKANTLLRRKPDRIEAIPTIGTYEDILSIEKDSIWQDVIVGKSDVDIASLISKLNISDWVNQGRQYLSGDETCPFCQQKTIDNNFRAKIEDYFDESFEKSRERVKSHKERYSNLCNNILTSLYQTEESEKAKLESKLDIDNFSAHLKALHSQTSENNILIKEKLEKTGEVIELTDTKPELDAILRIIENTNHVINENNRLVGNYDQEVASLKKSVWRFLVGELINTITKYENLRDGLQRGINSIASQIEVRAQSARTLENEVIELSKNVTSVQPAVDEINRTLRSYGFTNFQIVRSPTLENHYAIQRENGEHAHETLSEGEITFLTFLYFVQLAKGALDQDSVTDDRFLVIDDPISSLDSNVLYMVSTIVKNLIRDIKENFSGNIKQLILLTHNVYFHKEVSFQGGRSNGCRDTHFWILRKNLNVTSVKPYGQENPIESSYELLWREIKEWEYNSGITLQNTMRRIVENYFKILGGYTDDGLVERFETLEDQQICRSLISWINDGSHTIPDDLYVQAPGDSAEKYIDVFEKIFKYTDNHGHYKMMMGVEY